AASADTSLRWTSPTEWRRSWSNLSVEHRNERAEAEHDDVVGRLRGRSRAKRGEPFGLGGMQLNEWLFPLKAFREMQAEADGEVSRARTSPAVNARDPTRSRRLRSAPRSSSPSLRFSSAMACASSRLPASNAFGSSRPR